MVLPCRFWPRTAMNRDACPPDARRHGHYPAPVGRRGALLDLHGPGGSACATLSGDLRRRHRPAIRIIDDRLSQPPRDRRTPIACPSHDRLYPRRMQTARHEADHTAGRTGNRAPDTRTLTRTVRDSPGPPASDTRTASPCIRTGARATLDFIVQSSNYLPASAPRQADRTRIRERCKEAP